MWCSYAYLLISGDVAAELQDTVAADEQDTLLARLGGQSAGVGLGAFDVCVATLSALPGAPSWNGSPIPF